MCFCWTLRALLSGHSMAMQCYHRLGNFDVLIGVCMVSKFVVQGRSMEIPVAVIAESVTQCLLVACLAGGLGKLTHTLSTPLQN